MQQLIVTNQQELETVIDENVHAEVLLNGEVFTLPTSDKIHAFTFVGVNPQMTVYLTGTQSKSNKYDPKEHKVLGYQAKEVNQFNTVYSAKCENLTVTATEQTELYFQTREEFDAWVNVKFDTDKLDIVILEDEINSSDIAERDYQFEEDLKEIGEFTVEFIKSIQKSFGHLFKL